MDDRSFPEIETGRAQLADWQRQAASNSFEGDSFFGLLLRRHLGVRYDNISSHLHQVAEAAGPELSYLVAENNRDENLPVLRRHDAIGRNVEEVVHHPTYHEIGRVFWASGVLSVLADPGNEVVSGAIAYLLDQQGEAGHACPVACTAGAIKLIQRLGTDEQRSVYLPLLLEPNYRRRLHAAQFVTEVQGGSDVGANGCVAVPADGREGWY